MRALVMASFSLEYHLAQKLMPVDILRGALYNAHMILSFKDDDSRELYETGENRRFASIARVALRKMDMVAAATKVETLRIPPGNRLEQLKGRRKGQWSIRINAQWRICFAWVGANALDVEIVDYH